MWWPSNDSGSLLVRAARALSEWSTGRSQLDGLAGCPPDEVARIARDLNLSRSELTRLAALGPHAADEVYQRLDVLDIDAERLQRGDPALVRELVRVCSFCASKARCNADLRSCPDATGWAGYCPNAVLLQSLQSAPGQPEPTA